MKFLFLIQARLGSSRLPGKVLKPIFEEITLLQFIYKRVLLSEYATIDNVVVLITDSTVDDALADFLRLKNIPFFRGSEQNVYSRFLNFLIAQEVASDYFFRICSDNPFLEPAFIDNLCKMAINQKEPADYLSYIAEDGIPVIQKKYGLFAEMIKTATFIDMEPEVASQYNQEHVTPLLYQSGKYNCKYLALPEILENSGINFSVDTEEDLKICRQLLGKINSTNFSYHEVLNYV